MKMVNNQIPSNDQRPPKEIIKQWWPQAYDEFDVNPEASSLPIWVVATLLFPARKTTKIIEKAEELLYLCQNFRIPCEGDCSDRYEEYIINPMFPDIKGKRFISGLTAKLSKETVTKLLQAYREWPLAADVPLSKWWGKERLESLPTIHQPDKPLDKNNPEIDNVNAGLIILARQKFNAKLPLDNRWRKKRLKNLPTIQQPDEPLDKKNPEIGNTNINPRELTRQEFIIFTKSVLDKYSYAKTADLRRHCFDDMEDLNSRETKIINDLLIIAGAKKSKKGEHSEFIVCESKYPKAQWERVFNRNK
jgi:hypothetical protein